MCMDMVRTFTFPNAGYCIECESASHVIKYNLVWTSKAGGSRWCSTRFSIKQKLLTQLCIWGRVWWVWGTADERLMVLHDPLNVFNKSLSSHSRSFMQNRGCVLSGSCGHWSEVSRVSDGRHAGFFLSQSLFLSNTFSAIIYIFIDALLSKTTCIAVKVNVCFIGSCIRGN